MIYFDWTATTPVSDKSLSCYVNVSKVVFGNPSSSHPIGLQAKKFLEENRSELAEILEVDKKNIFFTSGGTEADCIVIQSLLNNFSSGEIIVSGIEHSAVLENRTILEKFGWKFTALKCPKGYLRTEDLENALNENVRMVCIMAVNNVTGTVQDLRRTVNSIRNFEKKTGRKIHIHCDAVQALGKITFKPQKLDIDSAAFSAHKIFGPRGVGFLYCKNRSVLALSKGGGQESGLRAGTENVPAIAAMVQAVKDACENIEQNFKKVSVFRKKIEESAIKSGFHLISPSSDSGFLFSPYILCISTPSLPAEVFLRIMADKGFCLSAGSACSTNSKGKAESVLSAMNINPDERMKAVRISLSYCNTDTEIEKLAKELENGKY